MRAAAIAIALQMGHFTFECKNEPTYQARPSRTQQLKNPKVMVHHAWHCHAQRNAHLTSRSYMLQLSFNFWFPVMHIVQLARYLLHVPCVHRSFTSSASLMPVSCQRNCAPSHLLPSPLPSGARRRRRKRRESKRAAAVVVAAALVRTAAATTAAAAVIAVVVAAAAAAVAQMTPPLPPLAQMMTAVVAVAQALTQTPTVTKPSAPVLLPPSVPSWPMAQRRRTCLKKTRIRLNPYALRRMREASAGGRKP